jgi:hypothetical protein
VSCKLSTLNNTRIETESEFFPEVLARVEERRCWSLHACGKRSRGTITWTRMVSSGMLRRVAFVRIDVSEQPGTSFIRVTKICELGTTQAATSRTVRLQNGLTHRKELYSNSNDNLLTEFSETGCIYASTNFESTINMQRVFTKKKFYYAIGIQMSIDVKQCTSEYCRHCPLMKRLRAHWEK